MPKFKTRPFVIEAHRWFKNGDHPQDYAKEVSGFENGSLRTFTGAERAAKDWEGSVVRYFRNPTYSGDTVCDACGFRFHVHGFIDTRQGGHRVCPGDWIITTIQNEHYPCKPDVFSERYEQVEG